MPSGHSPLMVAQMSESREPNGDTPLWVRILFRYGIVGFLALASYYVLVSEVRGGQKELIKMFMDHANQSERGDLEMRFFLRAICINAAKDDAQRAGCVLPGEAR